MPAALSGLSRRDLLKYASATALGATALSSVRPSVALAAGATPQWPGHKPGSIYVGLSTKGDMSPTIAKTGPIGASREFYSWTSGKGEMRDIAREHAAGRLPWVSFKPPYTGRGVWKAVASGRFDADIRARAQRYASLRKPVIVTFNHEPQTDIPGNGSPADFAAAWTRIYDVMKGATGLKNVAFVPIIGEWVFNPVNKGPDAQTYLTAGVLSRMAFLGVDLYQNQSGETYADRLPRILTFLDQRGQSRKMIGIGETGATNGYRNTTGARWWSDSWSWASAHTDRIGIVSYFSSLHSNNSGNNWLLTESADKLNAFRASVASPKACRL